MAAFLPSSAAILEEQWDIVEKAPTVPTWDFVWNGAAEEGREKQFVQQAFVLSGNEIPAARLYPSEEIYVADSAIKVASFRHYDFAFRAHHRGSDCVRYTE